MQLLSTVEDYLYGLAFEFPCDITFDRVSIPGILKNAGVQVR